MDAESERNRYKEIAILSSMARNQILYGKMSQQEREFEPSHFAELITYLQPEL